MRILKTNLAQLHQINYAKNIFAVSRGLSRCMTSCNASTPITDEYIYHKGEKIIAKSGLKADSEKKTLNWQTFFERGARTFLTPFNWPRLMRLQLV